MNETNHLINCGWGRILYGPSYVDVHKLAEDLLLGTPHKRDIAFFLKPESANEVLKHSDKLSLNTSYTYRLDLAHYQKPEALAPEIDICTATFHDVKSLNALYQLTKRSAIEENEQDDVLTQTGHTVFIAKEGKEYVGGLNYLDHTECFEAKDNSASVWALTIHPEKAYRGIGQRLIRHAIETAIDSNKKYLDLSVQVSNERAIGLYEKLGFQRIEKTSLKTQSQTT